MKLILVGCEYTGKTTLQLSISAWLQRITGSHRPFFHDHFALPSGERPPINSQYPVEIQEEVMALSPKLKEMFQRYIIEYHLGSSFYEYPDHGLVGFHIEEAVYAPLYYGYGGPGEYADRRVMARSIEAHIMEKAPDTILVLLKASVEVIAKRMCENPRPMCLLQEQDIGYVLGRFEEEYSHSLIRKRFVLDTGEGTIEDTFSEFVTNVQPLLTDEDRLRILSAVTPPRRAAIDANLRYYREDDLRRILSSSSPSRREDGNVCSEDDNASSPG